MHFKCCCRQTAAVQCFSASLALIRACILQSVGADTSVHPTEQGGGLQMINVQMLEALWALRARFAAPLSCNMIQCALGCCCPVRRLRSPTYPPAANMCVCFVNTGWVKVKPEVFFLVLLVANLTSP